MRNPKLIDLKNWTRRDFLKASGGCSALTSATFLSTLANLQLTKSAVAAGDTSGYKALVCLFQHGGNDSFNMLAPTTPGEYEDYVGIRSGLALRRDAEETLPAELLGIAGPNSRQFGIHHAMPEVKQLYDDGNLAFLANVGSLIAPTTMAEYQARTNLPVGLFSHSDEQRHWQTCVPQSRTQITGWAGRMADMITDAVNTNAKVSMNISVGLVNILQAGEDVVPYVIHRTQGAQVLHGYNWGGVYNKILTETTDSVLAETFTDLLEKTHADRRRSSIDAAVEFNNAIQGVAIPNEADFPGTSLGQQLLMTAKTIAAHEALGHNRQIFLVERGGWDHHANLKNNQANMLPEVSQALKAFYDATELLGCENEVTTFSISDFSRTLTQNGSNGSDHAWGSNVCIMGGAVNGGNIYGDYPTSLDPLKNNIDVGRGRLIPSTPVDKYAAELARWFGVSDTDLPTILPNLGNFDNTPLGIL